MNNIMLCIIMAAALEAIIGIASCTNYSLNQQLLLIRTILRHFLLLSSSSNNNNNNNIIVSVVVDAVRIFVMVTTASLIPLRIIALTTGTSYDVISRVIVPWCCRCYCFLHCHCDELRGGA